MKIGLNMGEREHLSSKEAENRSLQKAISACKKGDWAARDILGKMFLPWLRTLAEKRTDPNNTAQINALIEKGKDALCKAARKFKIERGAHHFRVFAVPFVEKAMDHSVSGGIFSRIFGRK